MGYPAFFALDIYTALGARWRGVRMVCRVLAVEWRRQGHWNSAEVVYVVARSAADELLRQVL
jgi:hypothetical protein